MPKNFVEEPFCVSENFCYRKKLGIREREGGGGRYQDFPSKTFCLRVPKIFVGGHFRVSLISGIEKFYAYEGNITIFYKKNCCLTVPKNFVGEPFCVSQNFWYRKNLWIRGGGRRGRRRRRRRRREGGREGGREYHNFLSKIFCLTVPKNFVGEPFCAVSENFW